MSWVPKSVRIKSFFGFFCTTPFEDALLLKLSESLPQLERAALESQLYLFNKATRLLTSDDSPDAYGYVEFHRVRWGRVLWDYPQKFLDSPAEYKLATARVKSNSGTMDVCLWVVRGILFSIEFRSASKVFYPVGRYEITELNVHYRKAG